MRLEAGVLLAITILFGSRRSLDIVIVPPSSLSLLLKASKALKINSLRCLPLGTPRLSLSIAFDMPSGVDLTGIIFFTIPP